MIRTTLHGQIYFFNQVFQKLFFPTQKKSNEKEIERNNNRGVKYKLNA